MTSYPVDNNLHASPAVKLGYCASGPFSVQPTDNAETTLIHDHEYSEAVSPALIMFNTTHEPSKTQCDFRQVLQALRFGGQW